MFSHFTCLHGRRVAHELWLQWACFKRLSLWSVQRKKISATSELLELSCDRTLHHFVILASDVGEKQGD